MNPHVTPADRTRTELAANRDRFREEGVPAYRGPASARVTVPLTSRYEITVRPAWRASERRETPYEQVEEWIFERGVPALLYPSLGMALLLTLAAAVYHAFAGHHG